LAKEWYIDKDSYAQDIKRLSILTKGEVSTIHLMGGEPLLHREINEIMTITRHYFKKTKIEIVTNGILLPKQEKKFWETCREYNIGISISYYPIKIDWTEIIAKANDYRVNLRSNINTAERTFSNARLDINGKQNYKNAFRKCTSNTINLRDGKLFTCSWIPYSGYFAQYFHNNVEAIDADYIDIYKAKDIKEIIHFLNHPVPFCRFCQITKSRKVDWGISKKEIAEWAEVD
jgi:hypothetical protein